MSGTGHRVSLLKLTSRPTASIAVVITTRLYRDGALVEKNFPVADISDYRVANNCAVWADFVSPDAADLATIEEELDLHPLAIEDAVHDHQRPKLDQYDSHFFLAAYAVALDVETGQLEKHEIKAFITKGALVTVHNDSFDMAKVLERWDNNVELSKHGVAFLLWGLLDVLVDGHFDVVQTLDSQIDEIEDALFDDRPRDKEVGRRSYELRKSLVMLRRVVLPMREVVNSLIRRDIQALDNGMSPYFQDIYDHVLRVTEWNESLRDLVSTIVETNIGLQGNRMNLIMKKVTSWAAIIAVPTAITGFFGQNLQFPGFGTGWGVLLSSALILVTGGALYLSFKKRDWL